jgi:methylmalonyl-CoA mutase cobalamin-binding subunit
VAEWPAAEQRPPGYPAALPFVPDSPVRIEEAGGEVVMTWLAVARPADLVQQLIGACATSGWHRTDAPGAAARFRTDDAERIIEVVYAGQFSFVTLTERGIMQT